MTHHVECVALLCPVPDRSGDRSSPDVPRADGSAGRADARWGMLTRWQVGTAFQHRSAAAHARSASRGPAAPGPDAGTRPSRGRAWLALRGFLALLVLAAATWSVLLLTQSRGGIWPIIALAAGALSLAMIALDVRARRRQRAPGGARGGRRRPPPRADRPAAAGARRRRLGRAGRLRSDRVADRRRRRGRRAGRRRSAPDAGAATAGPAGRRAPTPGRPRRATGLPAGRAFRSCRAAFAPQVHRSGGRPGVDRSAVW